MTFARRQFLHLAAGATALPAVSRIARAQAYPSRPITIVVPYAAGGPTDVIARVLGQQMRGQLGQPVLVENVVGAGGSIALGRVAHAPRDGYTVVLGNWGTHVALGAVYKLDYDLLKDFEPVAQVPGNLMIIVTRKTVPANNLKELIAWLKGNQDKVTVGTSGVGGGSHIAGVFFQTAISARFQFVPYRGAGPAMNDLVAGQIDLMVDASPDCLPHLCRQQAQCRCRIRGRRSVGAHPPCRSRVAISAAGGADAGGARCLAESRDRQMVADHQGCRDQGRIAISRQDTA